MQGEGHPAPCSWVRPLGKDGSKAEEAGPFSALVPGIAIVILATTCPVAPAEMAKAQQFRRHPYELSPRTLGRRPPGASRPAP